jgi:Tfp pilus assembly protein PilW
MSHAAQKVEGRRLKGEGQKERVFSGFNFQPSAFILQPRRDRGVTLIELIVFIVIVAIVVVVLAQAFTGTGRGMATGKMLTAATQADQQRMEVILAQVRYLRSTVGYSGITAGNYDPCPPVGSWANQSCLSGSSTVTSSVDFSSNICGAGAGTDCFQVTVNATDVTASLGSPVKLVYQVWNY